jgi:membrane AbrB-like protein
LPSKRFNGPYLARVAATLLLSAAGGFIAQYLGMPAGWVAGGLLAVAVASLAGFNSVFPHRLQAPVFLLVGISAGSGVSPETLVQMRTWPGSFAILGVALVTMIASSSWWLQRRCGWDRSAALLASLPGALSLVMAIGEGMKTDMKKVAISQSLRVLILVELIPLIALLIGHEADPAHAARPATVGFLDLVLLVAAGATFFLTGTVEGRLPGYFVVPGTIALAAITGTRFRPGDLALLPRLARPALSAFAIAGAISMVWALVVTLLFGVSFIQALLAFAPGAFDALTILAFQMNIDPAYVAAHHVARFIALTAAIPLLARWLSRGP